MSTVMHSLIVSNTARELGNAFEAAEADCHVLALLQQVSISDQKYYLPDLVITCGKMLVDSENSLQNPSGIMEVLSPDTAAFDRGQKFEHYQRIPTLRHYVLIEQDRASVTHYEKLTNNLWTIVGLHTDLSDALTFTVGETTITVPLTRIYRRITFPEPPESPIEPTEE